ncbi:hypothetical protein PFISCL1PPCAC_2159, partial [Pristionchus fissidentatus]
STMHSSPFQSDNHLLLLMKYSQLLGQCPNMEFSCLLYSAMISSIASTSSAFSASSQIISVNSPDLQRDSTTPESEIDPVSFSEESSPSPPPAAAVMQQEVAADAAAA